MYIFTSYDETLTVGPNMFFIPSTTAVSAISRTVVIRNNDACCVTVKYLLGLIIKITLKVKKVKLVHLL